MATRRDVLKIGAAGAGYGLLAPKVGNAELVFPDGFKPSIQEAPSPSVRPFVVPLNVMPIAKPVDEAFLSTEYGGGLPPDPQRHQRYDEFKPQKFYVHYLEEFLWRYHSDPPYNQGSWSWGFREPGMPQGITPGLTFHAKYGEPAFVRRLNRLPPVGAGNVRFALPSTTIHLHNAHTASESDGIPQDYTWPGEFWDHHYANIPAGFDKREIMSTLWYHDHRMDFTAPNVYAGLNGFYLLFDKKDANDETKKGTYRLPSGKYDVPLILHDVQFDQNGQAVWDFFNPEPTGGDLPSALYTTHGMIGDRFTVNRIIQPFFIVEARKYRFRVLNGGPSRLYELYVQKEGGSDKGEEFFVISTDGNLLPRPIETHNIRLGVAERHDIIVDFSKYKPGDKLYLVNRMEIREDGAGWTGRLLDEGNQIMRFDVVAAQGPDPSRIPDHMRALPPIRRRLVRKERLFVFDYDNGLWTINGKLMDPNRPDALIEQGSAEIWTFRNAGNTWMHPIHSHFEEFQILEINGKPIDRNDVRHARKDVVMLGPNEEVKFYSRWRDFLGKHVMHCHNVVHEDHAMMIRWDIVPPGEGD
ncbi:MAG: multicopper oxidase family protein [Methylomicrobium sp.]